MDWVAGDDVLGITIAADAATTILQEYEANIYIKQVVMSSRIRSPSQDKKGEQLENIFVLVQKDVLKTPQNYPEVAAVVTAQLDQFFAPKPDVP